MLTDASERAIAYLQSLDARAVAPDPAAVAALDAFDEAMPGPAATIAQRVIAALQAEGTCWCGITVWQGRTAMRISVSSRVTTEADVERSLEAMRRVAAACGA